MAKFDVRDSVEEITEIVFAEAMDEDDDPNAYLLQHCRSFIAIVDGLHSEVFINDKEHAQNLIKALNKAIELGWLE